MAHKIVKRGEDEYRRATSPTGATIKYFLNDKMIRATSVPDDVKAELKGKTIVEPEFASSCHKAPLTLYSGEEGTNSYECLECEETCDRVSRTAEPERDTKTGQITKGVAQETNKNGTAGRPSKYNDDLPEKMLAYFDIEDPFDTFVTEEVRKRSAAGATTEITKKKMIAKKLPTFERFAHTIGVHYDTLREWATAVTNPDAEPDKQELKYPDFSEAYKRCKYLQKEFLIQNGLQGLYPAASFIFVAKNITDMVDRQTIEHQDKDLVEKRDAIDNWLDTLRDNVQPASDDTKTD